MVRAPEAESPTGVVVPVKDSVEQPKWMLRKEPHDRLLAAYKDIVKPVFDCDSMPYYTTTLTCSVSIDRSNFFTAGISYQLTDMLRGLKIFDYNRQEEAKKMDLEVQLTPFGPQISSLAENASIFFNMNTQDHLWVVQTRPVDSTREYEHPELVGEAKGVLKQSKRKIENNYGREYPSYSREYDDYDENGVKIVRKFDIYDADNIEEDEHTAKTILNLLRSLIEDETFTPLYCSTFPRNWEEPSSPKTSV